MLPLVKVWTDEDHAKLRGMVLAGKSPIICGAALKRTTASVKAQARRIGSPFPTIRAVRRRLREAEQAATQSASR